MTARLARQWTDPSLGRRATVYCPTCRQWWRALSLDAARDVVAGHVCGGGS